MTSLTTPGDIAGLVLLVTAIALVAPRMLASWLATERQAGARQPEEPDRLAGNTAAAPARRAMPLAQAVVIPQQRSWQSRSDAAAGQRPAVMDGRPIDSRPIDSRPIEARSTEGGLVEDRVPGPGPLEFEEAISPRDQ